MRTPLLAGLLAVLLPACLAGEITDLGGEGGEGSGSGSGEGEGSGSGSNNPTPRVAGTLDKSTITTELGKKVQVMVNLTSQGGFAGDVTVAGRVVDASDTAMPNITLTGPTNVTLAADATGTAMYEIDVPMNATGSNMSGMFKVELMSTAGNVSLTSMVTINAIYTVDYAANTGVTVGNHSHAATPNLRVKRGAVLRFHNSDTIDHIIHGGGAFPHEDTVNGGSPGRNYDVETIGTAPGSSGTLGCHTHGTATYSTYTVE